MILLFPMKKSPHTGPHLVLKDPSCAAVMIAAICQPSGHVQWTMAGTAIVFIVCMQDRLSPLYHPSFRLVTRHNVLQNGHRLKEAGNTNISSWPAAFLPLDVDPVPIRSKETGGAACRVTVTFPMCGIGGGNWRSNVVGVCNRCTRPGGKGTFCLFLFSTGNFFFTVTPPTD